MEDIGKIVARVFASPETYIGQTLEMAGDALTGDDLASAIARATGTPLTYARFPREVQAQVPMIKTLVAMIDGLEHLGAADIGALRKESPPSSRLTPGSPGPAPRRFALFAAQ